MAVIKRTIWFLGVAAAAVAVAALFVYFGNIPMQHPPINQVTIGTTTIAVEVADTESAREQGLSGRDSLGEGRGMLFVFGVPGQYGFWMKDMNFSLDILFVDASGKIVTIDSDLSPATYHQNPPETFYPSAPVKYVLEVPAGFAKAHGISVGDKMMVQ